MRSAALKLPPTDVRTTAAVALVVLSVAGVVGAGTVAGVATGGDGEAATTAASAVDDPQARDHGPNVTVWTAPHDARLGNESAIETARDRGRLTRDDTVAVGDTVVLRLTAAGLVGDLRAAEGRNDTERLRSLFDGDGAALSVVQSANLYPQRAPKTLGLLEPGAVTVVTSGEDTVYLVYDFDTLEAAYAETVDGRLYENESRTEIRPEEAYNVTVRVDGASSSAEMSVVERVVGDPAPGGTLYGVPGERRTVTLPTTVAPGTETTVELALDGRANRTATVVVGTDHRLRVPVDLSNVSGESEGTLTVTDPYYDQDSWRIPVRVRPERGEPNRVEVVRLSGSVRFRTGVNLSHPGFVAVFEDDGNDPIQVFGPFEAGTAISPAVYRELPLEPGDELRFVAVRDVDQDGEYDADDERFEGGDPVAVVTVEDGRPEGTTPTTAAPTTVTETTRETATTGSATAEPTTGRTVGAGSETTGGTQTGGDGAVPAPGVVGTVGAVLGAVAILARRRAS